MDDCVELARAFGERIATRFDLPVYLYAQAADAARAGQAADVRRGQYEGLKAEIDQHGREPDFGPARSTRRPARSPSALGRSSSPTTSTSPPRTSSSPSGSPGASASRAAACPKVQANGFWIEELGRAQVSMNLLDFAVTPLWLVWETVREVAAEDGVELAESELIGLAPLAALLAVADRAGAPPDDPIERPPRRRRRVPQAARLLAAAGPRAPPRGGPRRRRAVAMSGGVPGHRGRPQRRADARAS